MDAAGPWATGGLRVTVEVEQHAWPEPQRLGQLADVYEGYVPLASLDAAEVAACDSALEGQALLRPTRTLAQFGQPCAEQLAHVRRAVSTHTANAM